MPFKTQPHREKLALMVGDAASLNDIRRSMNKVSSRLYTELYVRMSCLGHEKGQLSAVEALTVIIRSAPEFRKPWAYNNDYMHKSLPQNIPRTDLNT